MSRLLLPIHPEATEELGIGRSTMYELIAAGAISTVKIGRRTLIPYEELQRYVRELATAHQGAATDHRVGAA